MTLSDIDIKAELHAGNIRIESNDEPCIQQASVDFRLGADFKLPKRQLIDIRHEIEYFHVKQDSILIPGKSFILGTTAETIMLPNTLCAKVEGRSSIGRAGLFIQNAGWIDPGFYGMITLELFNANSDPIRIYAGTRICQIIFSRLESPAEHGYRGKYQGQHGTVGSRIHQDDELHGLEIE